MKFNNCFYFIIQINKYKLRLIKLKNAKIIKISIFNEKTQRCNSKGLS